MSEPSCKERLIAQGEANDLQSPCRRRPYVPGGSERRYSHEWLLLAWWYQHRYPLRRHSFIGLGPDLEQGTRSGKLAALEKYMVTMSRSSDQRDGSKAVKLANVAETMQMCILAKVLCHAPAGQSSKQSF
jgi:hypothetical protein